MNLMPEKFAVEMVSRVYLPAISARCSHSLRDVCKPSNGNPNQGSSTVISHRGNSRPMSCHRSPANLRKVAKNDAYSQ